jgi:protein TonB
MNSNSILNSNLLDIIFENRNKDYGAYVLRRDYNKRLFKSLVAVVAFVVMFFCLQMLIGKNITNIPSLIIPDVLISSPPSPEKKIEPKKIIHTQVKSAKAVDMKAVIIKTLEEKAAPPDEQMPTSNKGNNGEVLPFEVTGSDGDNAGIEESREPVKPVTPVINREVVVDNPEVLPQFPGGINELIKFLRRNLNTPQELGEGEEIAVKVRFIVNYNGKLMGFDVVKSGGKSFDNEVIRVLKKMPEWIPGKTNGENISAYFIVPVKFTVSN